MDIKSLVIRVSQEGVAETQSLLDRLAASGMKAEKVTIDLAAASKQNTQAQKDSAQANASADQSFASLALRIAGYTTGLGLAVSATRRVITEIKDLAVESITLAASFERSRVTWGVLMQDMAAGSDMFDRLYSLAQRTSLTFQGTDTAAQMLKGYGIAGNELIDTLERLGDAARGKDDLLNRLALAYGQSLAQDKVLTRDLYQFVNGGIPIFQALADSMGVSVTKIQELTRNGEIGFAELKTAIHLLTDEGGQFNGMMETTAQTFEGKLSIAADNWRKILGDTAENILPLLKSALDAYNAGADEAIAKTNFMKAMSGNGGDIASAIAYAQGQKTVSQNTPNTLINDPTFSGWVGNGMTPEYWDLVVQELQFQKRERERLSGSYGGKTNLAPSGGVGPDGLTAEERQWRSWLTKQTGIDALSPRLSLDWERPSGTLAIKEWLGPLEDKVKRSIGTTFEEKTRKEFTTAVEAMFEGMTLTTGYWSEANPKDASTLNTIKNALALYGYTKPAKEAKYSPWEAPNGKSPADLWYRESLGINPDDAAYKSVDYYRNLGIRSPTDYWMPGIEAGNEDKAEQYRKLQTAARYSAFDWNFGTQFGSPSNPLRGYTGNFARVADVRISPPSEATHAIDYGKFDAFNRAWIAYSATVDASGRMPFGNLSGDTGRWTGLNDRGAEWMALNDPVASARMAGRAAYDANSRNAARIAFILKYGKTPEEVLEQINQEFSGSPELADQARNTALNALGLSVGASSNPSDPFAFSNLGTLMNGGFVSASNYPEMPGALEFPGIIAGENEMPGYANIAERKRALEAASVARMAAWSAYNQIGTSNFGWNGEKPNLEESWRMQPSTSLLMKNEKGEQVRLGQSEADRLMRDMAEFNLGRAKTYQGFESANSGRSMYQDAEKRDPFYGLGTIDLNNRPILKNADGSMSTVRSTSFNIDGQEVLIPTVGPNGEDWSAREALNYYMSHPDQFLGKFSTPEEADAYAQQLHLDQEKLYSIPTKGFSEGQPGIDKRYIIPIDGSYVDRYSGKTGFEKVQDPYANAEAAKAAQDELKAQDEAVRELEATYKRLGDTIKSSLEGAALEGFKAIGEALAGNKNAAGDFGDAIGGMALQLLNQLPLLMLEAGLQGLVVSGGTNPLAWALVAGSGLVAIGAGAANYAASGEGKSAAHVSDIEGFASGTESAPYSQWAWVGENGRELMRVPRGSQIIPNHLLGAAANGLALPGYANGLNIPDLSGPSASSQSNVIINIKNAAPGYEVTKSESQGMNGERIVELSVEKIVKKMAADGRMHRAMGLQQAGSRVGGK